MIETLDIFADQVTTMAREVGVEGKLGGQAKVPGASGTWKDLTDNVNQLAANLTTQVRAIAEVAVAVTKGDLTRSITVETQGEVAALKDTINEMIRNLRDSTQKNTEQDWLKTNLAKFSRMLQGQRDQTTVGRLILSELAPVVSAQLAVFYVLDQAEGEPVLRLLANYGGKGQEHAGEVVGMGQGLVGQCALQKQKIHLTNIPSTYFHISSGLGDAPPRTILVLPVVFEGRVKGVLELASFDSFSSTHQDFLDQLTESIGIVLNTIEANMRTEGLLKQSQSLAQELQSRQEELQQTNLELQDKAKLLAHQNQEVERKNSEVEQARQALEEKAKQLALTSKYKSEFLANMSHELRTPLNSLLILSDQLSKNPEGNLTPKQTEFAKTIHSSGNDLLMLINDILDLSKIESGTVVVDVGEVGYNDLSRFVERTFRHVAEQRGLEFSVRVDPALSGSMHTDAKRLQQVIKNLLSNAFKFTHQGGVTLSMSQAKDGWNPENDELNRAARVIAFTVQDTGIGIPNEKQQIIFEAFQQADGSTSRKYGGTGLGLAISRELSRLLGGEIKLASTPGRGSTFTLFLPQVYTPTRSLRKPIELSPRPAPQPSASLATMEPAADPMETPVLLNEAGDDRDRIVPGDRVLLIVENDLGFAKFLLDIARQRGFKGLVSSLGAAALAMAREYKPAAITLDIFLPDIEGWRVLDRLKHDVTTRHIPVCVVSTDDARDRAFESGAMAFLAKPVQSQDALQGLLASLETAAALTERRLVVAGPAGAARDKISSGLAGDDLSVAAYSDPMEAARAVVEQKADCLIVTGEMPGLADALAGKLEVVGGFGRLPVLLYGKSALDEQAAWGRLKEIATVRPVRSQDRLLDQAALVLHRNITRLPEEQRRSIEELHLSDKALAGRKVLVVDDDIRNIFALATVLEDHHMTVLSADNGRAAIRTLQESEDIEIVIMDIMMPEMDGMATMREIRRIPRLKDLPIVAVTAKAMKGDREKCIEAGAWDYLAKPVDTDQLMAVLRAWLHR